MALFMNDNMNIYFWTSNKYTEYNAAIYFAYF